MGKQDGRMRALYGADFEHKCGECCNYDAVGMPKCIAYSVDERDPWKRSATACGLFNRPFAQTGLRTVMAKKPLTPRMLELFGGQMRLDA